MRIENRKIVASFEAFLMVVSIFAFSFLMGEFGNFFEENVVEENGDSLIKKIISKLREPMISLVSAVGCCKVDNDGLSCRTTTPGECSSNYAEGVGCESTGEDFCRPGCCFNSEAGIYSPNVLKKDCRNAEWDGTDRFCNMVGAELGCCVLGLDTKYVTRGACETFTNLAFSDSGGIEWIGNMSNNDCILHRTSQEQGACVYTDLRIFL